MRTMTRGTVMCGAALCAAMLVGLSGCASSPAEGTAVPDPLARAFEAPPAWDAGDRPVSRALTMSARGVGSGPELLSRQRLASSPTPMGGEGALAGGVGELMRVQYAGNSAKAEEVIRTLAGEFLEASIVIDPSIVASSQLVTMSIDEEMTRGGVRDLIGGLATVYGWMILEQNGVITFKAGSTAGSRQAGTGMGPVASAPILRAQAVFETDTPAVRILRPDHVDVSPLATTAESFLSPGGSAVAVGRTLLLVDTVRNTNRIARIIDAVDVPAFEGVEIHTYRLAHRTAQDAATLLTTIATATSGAGEASGVSFIAVPGTRDVMVVARDTTQLTMARDLLATVDRPEGDASMGAYRYYIQHYNADELVRMMREFFGDRIEPAQQGGVRGPAEQDGATRMRLVLDSDEELLLIRATPEDYADLMSVMPAIDRPRQQVMLNAIVAEVSLQNRLEFGVDYFLNILEDEGTVLDIFGTPGLVANPTGSITLLGTSGQMIIQALRTESDVDVLQQPSVMVRDRAQAIFQVGGEVPVPSGSVTSDEGTAVREVIEREETGLELTVTPRINESGMVSLEINQVIQEVGAMTDLGPEFTTRELSTEVIVPHGKTILLAGIIQNNRRTSERRIPIAGDIPVVGAAFRNTTDDEDRRELMLAITPTIVSNPEQASGTVGNFLSATDALRSALHGNQDRLPQGVLNPEALQTPLGGWGETEEEASGPDGTDEDPAPMELERLINPASYEHQTRSPVEVAPVVFSGAYFMEPGH